MDLDHPTPCELSQLAYEAIIAGKPAEEIDRLMALASAAYRKSRGLATGRYDHLLQGRTRLPC